MLSAQTNRFIYEYKYIPNIKEKDTVRKDLMALDITDKGSVYESLSRIESDSIAREAMFTMSRGSEASFVSVSGGNYKKGTINFKVTKVYPEYNVFLSETAGSNRYKISDNKKQEWKISPDKQKIGNYTAQKATTSFGGRDWVAWFTPELPFPDGPYKFHGLPGLIVKLEDTTGSHVMTMIANKKMLNPSENVNEKKVGNTTFQFGKKELPATEIQFQKAWKDYIIDPAKEIRKNMSGSTDGDHITRFIYQDKDGKNIEPRDMIKNIESGVKRMLETNNNRIEPTLFN
jgi:GLPGLI family protein